MEAVTIRLEAIATRSKDATSSPVGASLKVNSRENLLLDMLMNLKTIHQHIQQQVVGHRSHPTMAASEDNHCPNGAVSTNFRIRLL